MTKISTSVDADFTDAPLHANSFAFTSEFPVIYTIDDVRPHIRPDEGINVHDWGEHFIGINYALVMPETFQNALDLECRGMVFDRKTGKILSRPLQKLFQIGERQAHTDLDLTQDNWVEKKLDGSMIAAFVHENPHGGKVLFHTRGGFSDHAKAAQKSAPQGTLNLVREAFSDGYTPCFEWTSPSNRIVVRYKTEQLTLLAMRDRHTGAYLPRKDLEARAAKHGVPVVQIRANPVFDLDSLAQLIEYVRDLKDEEGVILAFENGQRLKIKGLQYLSHHKIISDFGSKKNAQKAWLESAIDDISAILQDARGDALLQFGEAMDKTMLKVLRDIQEMVDAAAHIEQKNLNAHFHSVLPKLLVPVAFALKKDRDGMEQMRRVVSWSHRNLENVKILEAVIDMPSWSPPKGNFY